jgi:nucleoid-associated protein YgaU
VKNYVVQEGDMFWKIAEREWGDANLYPRLLRANGWFPNEPIIYPGQVIKIPTTFDEWRT